MSYMGSDPGDLSQDDMYGRDAMLEHPYQGSLVRVLPCPSCQHEDGTPNQDALQDISFGCVFGCGHLVDSDTGFCAGCEDHSANAAECETCGRQYEAWERGQFAYVVGTPR